MRRSGSGDRADRPGGGEPLPVLEDRGRPEGRLRRRHRDDRRRRSAMVRARPRTTRTSPSSWTLPTTARSSPPSGSAWAPPGDPAPPGREGVRSHGRVRRSGSPVPRCRGSRRRRRSSLPDRVCLEFPKIADLRYGRTRTSAPRSTANPGLRGPPLRAPCSSREGALVQQHPRCGCRGRARADLPDVGCAIIKHGNPCGGRLGPISRSLPRRSPATP